MAGDKPGYPVYHGAPSRLKRSAGRRDAKRSMNMPVSVTADRLDTAIEFPISPVILPGLVRALDLFIIATSGLILGLYFSNDLYYDFKYCKYITVFICFTYLFLAGRANLFSINAIMRPVTRSDDIFISMLTSYLLFLSLAFAFEMYDYFSRVWFLTFAGGSFVAITTGRILLCRVLRHLSNTKTIGRSMVVLGVGEQSRRFLERLRNAHPYFIDVAGVFHGEHEPTPRDVAGYPVLGGVDALLVAARERKIDDVLVAMPWNADQELARTIERLKELPINVFLSTDLIGFELAFRPVMGNFTELPMFEVVQRPISGWASALKYIEDYLIASLLLILLSPLLITIAIAIRIDSPGPIFFLQKRLGFNNKVFSIYKFRSMHHHPVSEEVVRQATRGDPRVTRVGRIIRATSLDELPQLLNVLNGTMSLVGPRPHAVSHNEEYGRKIRGYFARHKVKPGITGWAQINGHRGETDTLDKMQARIEHDIYYTENWSIFFDIRIMIMTAIVVLFQRTAY